MSDEVVANETTPCQPIEGFEIAFEGSDTISLRPVSSGTVQVDGDPLTAWAIAAWDYGQSANCEISDASGYVTWMVHR